MSLVDECGFRLNGTLVGLRRLELLYVLREQQGHRGQHEEVPRPAYSCRQYRSGLELLEAGFMGKS